MTRQRIVEVGRGIFARKGYDGTSLADIAKVVGIQKSTIYAHFVSKEELFLAVFTQVLDAYVQRLVEIEEEIRSEVVERKLYRVLEETCSYYQRYEDEAALLKRAMMFPPEELRERVRALFLRAEEQTSQVLTAIFTEGIQLGVIRAERIDDLIASFYCLSDGLFLQLVYYAPEQFEERRESAWQIYWQGISRV